MNGERGSADKGKEEDNLVLGMYAKTHEDYERMNACCLGVKWIKALVMFERRRGGAWKNKRLGRSMISYSIEMVENEMKVGKLAFILECTKDHFALFP